VIARSEAAHEEAFICFLVVRDFHVLRIAEQRPAGVEESNVTQDDDLRQRPRVFEMRHRRVLAFAGQRPVVEMRRSIIANPIPNP